MILTIRICLILLVSVTWAGMEQLSYAQTRSSVASELPVRSERIAILPNGKKLQMQSDGKVSTWSVGTLAIRDIIQQTIPTYQNTTTKLLGIAPEIRVCPK